MEEKLSGIVIGGVSYGENDRIINVFTLEKGVVSAKIKGVKKAGAKLKFAAEPFCFAEYVFSKTQDKRTVIGASLIDSFYPVREDIKKYFAGGAVLEFIRRFYKESMVDTEEFFLCVSALKGIAYGDNPLSKLTWFLISALKNVGYKLTLSGCFKCENEIDGKTFFDYNLGAFLCENCFDGCGREINLSTMQALALAENDQLTDNDERVIRALKLLQYYLLNGAEEKISSLNELISVCEREKN